MCIRDRYKNGEWVKADSRVEDSHVVVAASEFASYGLFLGDVYKRQRLHLSGLGRIGGLTLPAHSHLTDTVTQ